MGYYVPQTLQKINNWVLWDKDKKPCSAKFNGGASVNNSNHWTSYERALAKLQYTDDYNGLGFIFSENCGLVFIDLDNCIDEETGELTAFASGIVEAFKGTYIEYSQSGKGLHIVCRGAIPAAYKRDKIEIYSTARHMAFTGNAYEAKEPADRQKQLDELCARFNITKRESTASAEHQPITAADKDVIKRCEKWKDFNQLYYEGLHTYTKAGGELDNSRADYRLAFILLSCCNGNREQAERLFMQSKLAEREKCKRSDYVKLTLEKAAHNVQTKTKKTKPITDQPMPKKWRRL